MENNNTSVEDIKAIRRLMEESSRFLSLSGLSGILAGILAIAGAVVAFMVILRGEGITYEQFLAGTTGHAYQPAGWKLLADAVIVLLFAVASSLLLSYRKALSQGKAFWTPVSKRLLLNLLVPLITGAILISVLIIRDDPKFIIPFMLVFYGLALASAGKFTYGLLEIVTGLAAAFFPGYGLIFWAFGFGLLHIIYGLAMYRKYEV